MLLRLGLLRLLLGLLQVLRLLVQWLGWGLLLPLGLGQLTGAPPIGLVVCCWPATVFVAAIAPVPAPLWCVCVLRWWGGWCWLLLGHAVCCQPGCCRCGRVWLGCWRCGWLRLRHMACCWQGCWRCGRQKAAYSMFWRI